MSTISHVYDSAHRPPAMLEELLELWRYRDLLMQLVVRNLKIRYKRSVLGLFWTMLNPLLMMTILTIVFSNVFRITLEHYAVYVLAGLVLWNFFAQATLAAMGELVWGSGLLHRIYVPRAIFSLAAISTGAVNLLFALIPLALVMLATQVPLRAALLFLPLAIALTVMFATGVGLALATLAVFFVDMIDIYQVVLTAWMYLSPIIYPKEILPTQFQWLLLCNPMYYFLEMFRAPVYAGVLPEMTIILPASAWACLALAFGWWVFTRNADGLAYRL